MKNYSFQGYAQSRDEVNESLFGMGKNLVQGGYRAGKGFLRSAMGDRKGGEEDLRNSGNSARDFGSEFADTAATAGRGLKAGAGIVGRGLSRLAGGAVRRAAQGADKLGQNMGSTYGEPPTIDVEPVDAPMAQVAPTPPIAKPMMARDLGKFITQLKTGNEADQELAGRIEGPFGIWLRKQDKATTPKPKATRKTKATPEQETEPMIPINKPARSRKRAV